jgi:hypothetical protein
MPSLYDTTVPAFVRGLTALSHILTVAENFAKENGISEADFTSARLAPDMLPFMFQIQNTTNAVRNALTLVAQINFAAFENAETTFADLQSRIALTQRALEGTDAKSFEGAATRTVERQGKPFTGLAFLTQISIPNFYFHISIAYAILRSNGVQLGKQDYLNGGQEA